MLASDWLIVVYLIFGATPAHQNFNRKLSHNPNKQTLRRVREVRDTNTYRSFRTEERNKVNRLLLLTVSPNWVTLKPQRVRKKLKRTEMQTVQQKRSMRTVTYNAKIEVDVKTPFVPMRKVPEILRSVIHSNKSIKHRRAANENQPIKTPREINNFETETDSLDMKVLSRIQQLENELNAMKVQIKNDSETIDNLKSKIVEKDEEIAELMFINETAPMNKNNDIYKREDNVSPIDTPDATTRGIMEGKPVGSENKPETNDVVNLYVPDIKSLRRNNKYTIPPSQKGNDNNPSEGKPNKASDKHTEHNGDDGNSNQLKHVNNEKHTTVVKRNNNQEAGNKRETNAKQYKEMTQDGNIVADKFEKVAEIRHPVSKTFNLGDKTRTVNAQNKKDNEEIQFSGNKEVIDPTKPVIPENPPTIDSEIDQLNPNDDRLVIKRRDFKTDYGEEQDQMGVPGGMVVNEDGQLVQKDNFNKDKLENDDTELINKKNPFFNSQEYEKKLNDERIESAIDWKTFNPSAFLAQLSAEFKEKTRMDNVDGKTSTIMPLNGRRMLSDQAIPIHDSPGNADKAIIKMTTDMYAPAPPGQRKLLLNSDMALIGPPGVEFKNDNDPSPSEVNEVSRRPLAPEAGKQLLTVDSTEDLVRNAFKLFSAGRSQVPPSLDFDVYRQKLHRDDGKEREKLHQKVAEKMNAKLSGRRSMNPENIIKNYDISEEILNDPFVKNMST